MPLVPAVSPDTSMTVKKVKKESRGHVMKISPVQKQQAGF